MGQNASFVDYGEAGKVVKMLSGARLVTLIPVKNMDRALRFYTKAVGGKLLFRGVGEMKESFASLMLGDDHVWLVTPSKREKRTLAYTTFLVKEIRVFVNGLKRKGVKFQRAQRMGPDAKVEGPISFESFGASAFFKDPEGNSMMVWQDFSPP
jgi:predicted enzyme related to lactoylglutathione lyase